jgi:hypothetical protein
VTQYPTTKDSIIIAEEATFLLLPTFPFNLFYNFVLLVCEEEEATKEEEK